MSVPHYVIITPVRNEVERVGKTIDSVAAQTIPPRRWIMVNDGSTDGTTELLDAAAQKHAWIRVVHRADRGCRKPGGGVMEAFYDGYRLLSSAPSAGEDEVVAGLAEPAPTGTVSPGAPAPGAWDFLVKLDGDLEFAPTYFAECFARFQADPRLGIGGGTVCYELNGQWLEEAKGDPPFHVRGATKIYRRACWEAIGGLLKAPGWDTLDEVKANQLGWRTYSFKEIKLLQLKSTGTADGAWRNWFKNGWGSYIVGYHPLFMFAKSVQRFFRPPRGVGGLALLCGFASGYFRRTPQVADPDLIRYLRRQQLNRLWGRPSLWG